MRLTILGVFAGDRPLCLLRARRGSVGCLASHWCQAKSSLKFCPPQSSVVLLPPLPSTSVLFFFRFRTRRKNRGYDGKIFFSWGHSRLHRTAATASRRRDGDGTHSRSRSRRITRTPMWCARITYQKRLACQSCRYG